MTTYPFPPTVPIPVPPAPGPGSPGPTWPGPRTTGLDRSPAWPYGLGTTSVPAATVPTTGAPGWLQELITAGRAVVWLDRIGGWALSSAEPRPDHVGYRDRCDCCRHELGCLIYIGADHGGYCDLACLTIAAHTCGDCGGDVRQGSDPEFGPVACPHGAAGRPTVAVPPMPAEEPTAPPRWWS